MTTTAWLAVAVTWLVIPLVLLAIDVTGLLRARRVPATGSDVMPVEDFQILVPIYGSTQFLENVDFLRPYGSRVTLCTTTHESVEFSLELQQIADAHGFRVFRGDAPRAGRGGGRATSGTVRDRLVRDASTSVTARYVVCIDADTTAERPVGELVGEMAARGLDVASVPLVPSHPRNGLARLQVHEYRAAMLLRRAVPWLVSGAFHAARTTAYRDIMSRHSLFFQGNDVEVGVLAQRLGYQVGHVVFPVLTSVPATARGWWRQRLAWAGGEVRLYVVNPQIALRHPFMWLYGLVVVLAALPLRWASIASGSAVLLVVAALYLGFVLLLHRAHIDRWLWLVPLYAAVTSLVLTPLGLWMYVRMAVRDRNAGLIRTRRGRAATRAVVPVTPHAV